MPHWPRRFLPIICVVLCIVVVVLVVFCRPWVRTPPTYTVGAYYYPWYHDDFHGDMYVRGALDPPQVPQLGEYDDRDAAVIGQHLMWSFFAGVDLWVVSWWGPNSREDVTVRDHILPHPNLNDLKIAVLYETPGRTAGFTDYASVGPDVAFIAQNYFDHPSYMRIDGRPVLFVYLTRVLSGEGTLASTVSAMRAAAAANGHDVFIVGDQVWGAAPSSTADLALLDGVTNYDVYGNMGATPYAGQPAVDAYYDAQRDWKDAAGSADVAFVPGTSPGFNDTAVPGRDHEPLSRRLTATAGFGSLFREMVRHARELADPRADRMIMVTSWNEWHEDTQIEPVRLAPPTSSDTSATGTFHTHGLEYEGYGNRYLQILRDEIP